ncbi:MAG: hypothetical protein M3R02_12130 [Chloroflexota bacterium]|nr:hypothetical protein [Chloroflexota bacterium]
MRGRPSVWTRTQRLAATAGDPLEDRAGDQVVDHLVEVIAAERGVPVAVLLAEAEAAVARWKALGRVTRATVVERVAAEHGVDPDAVRVELMMMGVGRL